MERDRCNAVAIWLVVVAIVPFGHTLYLGVRYRWNGRRLVQCEEVNVSAVASAGCVFVINILEETRNTCYVMFLPSNSTT